MRRATEQINQCRYRNSYSRPSPTGPEREENRGGGTHRRLGEYLGEQLLVAFDRASGARAQRGATNAHALAGRQELRREEPHLPRRTGENAAAARVDLTRAPPSSDHRARARTPPARRYRSRPPNSNSAADQTPTPTRRLPPKPNQERRYGRKD